MSTNLKVIKYTAIVSACFFVATFAICLNISYEWFNIKWLSNDFLLAIFSGVFASTLVVLICEIQKYFLNKTQAENSLYNCCTEMIARFMSSKTMLTELLKDKNRLVTEQLLEELCQHVGYQMNVYFSVDYTTYCKKQALFVARTNFNKFLIDTVQKTLSDCTYLDIVVNKSKIKNLQNGIPESQVTSSDKELCDVINALIKEFETCIDTIVSFTEKIDYSGRFNFKERFKTAKATQNDCKQENIEGFIKRNIN